MGIHDFLQYLPGGRKGDSLISFYDLKMEDNDVSLDAAGALWQFAAMHAYDFLRGNHSPALLEFAHLLIHLRSICRWKLSVYLDGMENESKRPEIERRKASVASALARGDLRGQIKNTPEYIVKAARVCQFLSIKCHVSYNEADPQAAYTALQRSMIPVTGDSDLLAYGNNDGENKDRKLSKLILVEKWNTGIYRVIDLEADVNPGEYPLFDLYQEHGRIAFQLYAGCSGCDFTPLRCGVPGIGYDAFISACNEVMGELSAKTLAPILWEKITEKNAKKAGFQSAGDVEEHLQRIVDVHCHGLLYDDNSNVIDMSGRFVCEATPLSKRHMDGEVHSRTRDEFEDSLRQEIVDMDCAQLIMQTAAEASSIRGVFLPDDRAPELCHVPDLRDFVAARGGKISMVKKDLVSAVQRYQFIEKQVPKAYVDRHPDPNGSLFMKINTSSTRTVDDILRDLHSKSTSFGAAERNISSLIEETYELYKSGLFDDKYDNIARVAPELKEGFIYRQFGHIGASIQEKNVGDALKRCFYETHTHYHAIAFVPGSNRVIILTKAHASMVKDEKTRNKTDSGEPEKQEYLLIMDLEYVRTNEVENGHSLGVFVDMKRAYCTLCIAGQGSCRHRPERLWYQYHHWTEERYGIEKPATIGACGWAPGGRALVGDMTKKIYEQQCVKYEDTIEAQTKKMERGVRRDTTEGRSCDYQVHYNSKKQAKQTLRFTKERCAPFFELLRSDPGDLD